MVDSIADTKRNLKPQLIHKYILISQTPDRPLWAAMLYIYIYIYIYFAVSQDSLVTKRDVRAWS